MEPDRELIEQLHQDEGLRLVSYPDPLSKLAAALALAPSKRPAGWEDFSGAPWTAGYGHTGPDVHAGMTITEVMADALLYSDLVAHNATLAAVAPWVYDLDPVRRRVLQNMHFNLGWDNPKTPRIEGLAQFRNTLMAVRQGRYDDAADGMRLSLWYRQTGDRAKRLVARMRTGVE